jgi:hypothetical protein
MQRRTARQRLPLVSVLLTIIGAFIAVAGAVPAQAQAGVPGTYSNPSTFAPPTAHRWKRAPTQA